MQKMIGSLIVAAAILRSDPVLVTRVTDGDTITVASIGRVSLLGIEAQASTPDELRIRIERDIAKWRAVIDQAGIPKQ